MTHFRNGGAFFIPVDLEILHFNAKLYMIYRDYTTVLPD